MPEMDGVEATRLIVESDSETRIIILTTFDLDEYVYAALRAGASGFLLKDTQPADLLSAIRAVANGDAVVAPRVTRRLLSTYSHRLPSPRETDAADRERLEQLTAREHEVLLQVARSLSNAEIARQLMSLRPLSSLTSAGSSPNWVCVTECKSSSSPTSRE